MVAARRSMIRGVFFLLLTVLLKKCASCPSFTSSVEEGRTVCPGEELTYTCKIFGDTGSSATVWRMTPLPCAGGVVALFHSTLGGPPMECGPFSAQLTANDSNCYTSTLTVTASLELNGTVVTCEDNPGNVAGSATINIETGSLDVVVTPVYDSVKLERTEIAWNAICSPMTEYNSTVVCGAYVDTYLAECPGETCVSVVDVSDNADDDCTVSVSAAALSEQRTVNIDNDFLCITVLDNGIVNYTFKNEFPGKACFSITFSYWDQDGMRVNTTEPSFQCLGYEDSTEVLQEFLPPVTKYNYVASTFECGDCEPGQFQLSVIVLGSGTTGSYEFGSCSATQLFGGNINQNCSVEVGGTEGGCADILGQLSPGSVVKYDCFGNYILQGNDTLVCQRNGVWSGNPPACIPPEASIFNIAVIILIVIAAILLVTTVIFFVLFIFCWKAQIHGKVSGGQRLGSPSEMKAL